jgi:hypothetical protein
MNAEQNDPGLRQWAAALYCSRPEVLVERRHDACRGLREIQEGDVAGSGERCAGRGNVAATGAKRVFDGIGAGVGMGIGNAVYSGARGLAHDRPARVPSRVRPG